MSILLDRPCDPFHWGKDRWRGLKFGAGRPRRPYNRSAMRIRRLRTPAEYLEAERVQRAVWHFPDREIIPLNEFVVLQAHGGHVLGAFDRGRMVGFCFGGPAFRDGKTYHYSRMLGALPAYQDSGLGTRLKLAQRDCVLAQGLDLIVWTFDPLRSRNAHFNLEKLGAVAREYKVNLYPRSGNRFNRGLESDRMTAEWWIAGRRVRDRLAGRRPARDPGAYPPAFETRATSSGWREPRSARGRPRGGRLSVEIPEDIDALKRDDLRLGRLWRRRTREAFLEAFRAGYMATGFLSLPEGRGRRGFYLLEKGHRVR